MNKVLPFLLGVLCALAVAISASAQTAPGFTIVDSPNAPGSNNNHLNGVAALSPNDVWAVGFFSTDSFRNLAMHWNGSTWTITPTPNPSQPYTDQLKKLAAIAPNDVWAIGGHGLSYSLRWNGAQWQQVPMPPINNRGFTNVTNFLDDIAGVASNDIWAVGAMDAMNGGTWTLTMHWDGTRWTQVPSPNQPTPSGSFYSQALSAVVAVSSNNVWAVGYYRVGNTEHPLIEHWDGAQWSIVPSPDGPTGDGMLHGIAAAGPNDIWAVGEYQKTEFNTMAKGLALHWDGTRWSVFAPPNPSPFGVNPLNSVVARGPNDFYAVGQWETGSQGLSTYVVHWTGTAWTQVASQDMPGTGTGWNQLNDIAVDSTGELWTVGSKQSAFNSPTYTLVERSNGAPTTPPPSSTPTPTPVPTPTPPPPTPTPAPSATPPPTTDRISITRAEYTVSKKELRVEATSSNTAATLKVYATSTNALIGALTNNGGGKYSGQFNVASNPQNITVKSSDGGGATKAVTAK